MLLDNAAIDDAAIGENESQNVTALPTEQEVSIQVMFLVLLPGIRMFFILFFVILSFGSGGPYQDLVKVLSSAPISGVLSTVLQLSLQVQYHRSPSYLNTGFGGN